MIFVDTSVWIAYLRRGDAAIVKELDELLDADRVALAAPVRLELLSGAPRGAAQALAGLLAALPTFFPSPDTFTLAESWLDKARRAGERFGALDLLIAAIAAERGGQLWSLDGDFDRLARLGLVKLLHRAKGTRR